MRGPRKRSRLLLACLFLGVLSLAANPGGAAMAGESQPGASEKSPDFEVVDINGTTWALAGILQSGKLAFLNFWGVRCGACLQEIPHLNEISRKYGDRVVFLGVNIDGIDAATLKQQMAKNGIAIAYHVVPDAELKLVDAFQVMGAPLNIIVDRKGMIRFRHENFAEGDEKMLEESVLAALKAE